MKISVAYDFLPKQPSSHASVVMDHFGIGFETGRNVIAEDLELPIEAGDVVCFTGASGSGKSSLMRAVAEQIGGIGGIADCGLRIRNDFHNPKSPQSEIRNSPRVLNIDTLDLGSRILVDSFNLPVQETLQLLSMCGLGEAQLLLRTPQELSDGQRYRFRLALGLSQKPDWIVADEFSATLDRTLAKVVAFNIRRIAERTNTGFLLATTHEDILEDLQPSLKVRCRLDGRTEWERRDVKKKVSALSGNSGSAKPPNPTGRISLGGITAATTSALHAS